MFLVLSKKLHHFNGWHARKKSGPNYAHRANSLFFQNLKSQNMSELSFEEIETRKAIARELLDLGRTSLDDVNFVDTTLLPLERGLAAVLPIHFPTGLAPVPIELDPKPHPDDKLPMADVVVVTWTADEVDGLAKVFTPGYSRDKWYRYTHLYDQVYAPQIRAHAPAANAKRIGSYFMVNLNDKKVLCFKSELHLNQDGIQSYNNTDQTSLPVRNMFKQVIQETGCKHILTVGTCGGIQLEHDLGDVLVTRAAKFRCAQEFGNAPFNNVTYKSEWNIPTTHFGGAETLMASFAKNLEEPEFGPPTKRHDGSDWKLNRKYKPNIIHEKAHNPDKKLKLFQPILTTDYFEFGHSANATALWNEGCGVEMGDAVLGLVCAEDLVNPPKWAIIRNVSDPQINGTLAFRSRGLDMRVHWAVWYYETYGYWTSVMSALATWAVIAGL